MTFEPPLDRRMASIGSYLPPPGSAVWRRDVPAHPHIDPHAQEGKRVRHVVIRDAQIWSKPAPYVVYRVDVLTEHDHWYMFKRYSQFYTLHSKLVKKYGTKVQLPPKKLSGNLSKVLIDKRRQSLETYLQKLVHGESQVSLSPELMQFLDVPTHDVIEVTDILTRHLYLHGDQLLEEATPISLSVNEMYAITKRLLFPRNAAGDGDDCDDVAADPAHLYSFVQTLETLKVSLPPATTSVCCSSFDLAHFRALHTFKMDKVPLSQVTGLLSIQQQLGKLSVHRGLHTLRELLIEAVEEKRGSLYGGGQGSPTLISPSSSQSWRISATARLTTSRVIVQPWHSLHTLTLSHNLLTHLDDSLQLLPVLRELNLSHNQLQELNLRFLCLPGLEKLSLSHNSIATVHTDNKVLERITCLNLSHNRLATLNWLHAFVGLGVLNMSYNLLSQRLDLDKLTQLRLLNTLTLRGNPITSSNACRLFILAKFMQKSRQVVLDGQEATSKEQAKLQALVKKHGPEPDLWPLAKSLTYIELSTEGQTPPLTPTQSAPDVEVSWQVQSSIEQKPRPLAKSRSFSLPLAGTTGVTDRPPSHRSFDQLPSPQRECSQERHLLAQSIASRKLDFRDRQSFEEQYTIGGPVSPIYKRSSLVSLSSREEPDGQSDISSVSPEHCLNGMSERSSVSILTPPPSTPLPLQEDTNKRTITPSMIRSALESLQQMQSNRATPQSGTSPSEHRQICPETVANALSVLINQDSQPPRLSVSSDTPTTFLTPPPSTPLGDTNDQSTNLSSSDLISALSALVVPGQCYSVGTTSGDSSTVTSVPACTPNEDRKEWRRLGFKPEDVIQALTALSLQIGEETDSPTADDLSLSPIQEEMVLTANKLYTTNVEARDTRNASESIDEERSPAPPDFVFSPPELNDCVLDVPTTWNSAPSASCSPSDDVLYS